MTLDRRQVLAGLAAILSAGRVGAEAQRPTGPRTGGVAFEAMASPVVNTISHLTPPPSGPLAMVLCLCMDMSRSVRFGDRGPVDEVRLQIDGTADALESPGVIAAIQGSDGGIGVLCTQFSDFGRQSVGFAVLRDAVDVHDYAALIRGSRIIVPPGETGITRGLSFSGAKLLQVRGQLGYTYGRGVIDISGDGRQGPDPTHIGLRAAVRELATQYGITVNGLAIQRQDDPGDLHAYYSAQVDTPPGFEHRRHDSRWGDPVPPGRTWRAKSAADFVRSMERKLQYEIAGLASGKTRG